MTPDTFEELRNKFRGTPEGLTRNEQLALLDEISRLVKLVEDLSRMRASDEPITYDLVKTRAARLRHANERGGYGR